MAGGRGRSPLLGDLGETDTVDKRRVKALLVLSRPDLAAEFLTAYQAWSDRPEDPDQPVTPATTRSTGGPGTGPKPVIDWAGLLPQVVVNVYVYVYVYGAENAEEDGQPTGEGIARVEGCGAATETWVKEHLSPLAKVTVRPVLDIEALAPVDAYEIPERHRQAVHLMTPADTFPFSPASTRPGRPHPAVSTPTRRGRRRTIPDRELRTDVQPHHRLTTFGRWTVKRPFPGIYLWRDPYGALYLVDHTGTRQLPRDEAA
ncbi:MAG TPA: hypothetical protein VGK78_04520 [Nocardioides sp.]|uniref:hypothetical protein n=1 Tax=Nocardioides sp. TaxID=35761 RepID=UPI002F3F0C7C